MHEYRALEGRDHDSKAQKNFGARPTKIANVTRITDPTPVTSIHSFALCPFSDQMHGCSAFYRDESGEIFHTYSTYARGVDPLNVAYQFLDLTAKGRDEDWTQEHPSGWVRHRYRFGADRSQSSSIAFCA